MQSTTFTRARYMYQPLICLGTAGAFHWAVLKNSGSSQGKDTLSLVYQVALIQGVFSVALDTYHKRYEGRILREVSFLTSPAIVLALVLMSRPQSGATSQKMLLEGGSFALVLGAVGAVSQYVDEKLKAVWSEIMGNER